jgi:hypothetical protein
MRFTQDREQRSVIAQFLVRICFESFLITRCPFESSWQVFTIELLEDNLQLAGTVHIATCVWSHHCLEVLINVNVNDLIVNVHDLIVNVFLKIWYYITVAYYGCNLPNRFDNWGCTTVMKFNLRVGYSPIFNSYLLNSFTTRSRIVDQHRYLCQAFQWNSWTWYQFNPACNRFNTFTWKYWIVTHAQNAPEKSFAPKRLRLVDTKSISRFRKSSNEIKKQFQILAKGHNATLEFVISVEDTKVAKNVIKDHVSENRGAREVWWGVNRKNSIMLHLYRMKNTMWLTECNRN